MKPLALAVCLGLLGVGATACTHDSGGAIEGPLPSLSSVPTTAATATPTTVGSLAGAGTTPVSTPPSGETALLSALKIEHQSDGSDRVTFVFTGAAAPGYSVRFVNKPVHEDASGRVITVAGNAVLQVRMEHASRVDLSGGSPHQTYNGPSRIPAIASAQVTEAVLAGDFEGVLTWDIGLRTLVPFRVSTASSPARLEVDVSGV